MQTIWTVWNNVRYLALALDSYFNKFQSGSATIPAGAVYVDVTGITVGAGFKVIVTPRGNTDGHWWITNIAATSFRITLANAVTPSAPTDFDWLVKAPN
jgi:hypothetical protein